MSQPIDRVDSLQGLNRKARDSRVPFNQPRSIINYSLPDRRAKRRLGFEPYSDQVVNQAVCKSTSVSRTKRNPDGQFTFSSTSITPLSYGVIRHQSDFQLKRASSQTFEFCLRLGDKEEFVINPYQRRSSLLDPEVLRGEGGVYVFDQTLMANECLFAGGNVVIDSAGTVPAFFNTPLTPTFLGGEQIVLTSLAVKFNDTRIMVEFNMFDSTDKRYWKCEEMTYDFPSGSYTVGDVYHVGIVHDHTAGTNGEIYLYINGSLEDTFVLPITRYVFVGEEDEYNQINFPTGVPRDIVILNEFTARASYSSTCRVAEQFAGLQSYRDPHFYSAVDGVPTPWCLSPPAGTAMWDLRIWTEAVSSTNILANAGRRLYKTDSGVSNMVGNWHMNDGVGVCVNHVIDSETLYLSLHHNYSSLVDVPDMLNDIGLKFSDGQYAIVSTNDVIDTAIGRGLHAQLKRTFEWNDLITTNDAAKRHLEQHSFTIQMQFMVPDSLQFELNQHNLSNLVTDFAGTESRGIMERSDAPADNMQSYLLFDGDAETFAGGRRRAIIEYGTPSTIFRTTTRAYDQTLFSIEGTQIVGDPIGDEADRRRIPLVRGLITPEGKVAIEMYKDRDGGSFPLIFRLLSTNTITPGVTYSVAFVQRAKYTGAAASVQTEGFDVSIILKDITNATAAVVTTASFTNSELMSTGPLAHAPNYDIIIGASKVNDLWDASINAMSITGVVPPSPPLTSQLSTGGRGDYGPWPVQQRFMSPYEDQPGNFICGMFRMWAVGLDESTIEDFSEKSVNALEYGTDMLINLEFEEHSGLLIKDKSAYKENFDVGYKGWGVGNGFSSTGRTGNYYLMDYIYEGLWANQDGLGYMPIEVQTSPLAYDSRQENPEVNGLAAYKTSAGQQTGILAVYGHSLSSDDSLDGDFQPLHIQHHGLLNEFSPDTIWRGTTKGTKTFLTSQGGIPKVYDGNVCTVAGFKRWAGGGFTMRATYAAGTIPAGWYGCSIVYFSEADNTYQYSPTFTFELNAPGTIEIYQISKHPDPRVTQIRVYITDTQATRSLAQNAQLRLHDSIQPNAFIEELIITDLNYLPVLLDRDITPFPVVAYSAVLNDVLYLAGDPVNVDTVYFSDPGNPERIDTLFNNFLIEQNTADVINGLISVFGALFVFKPNSVWRIDQIGQGQFQQTKISNVGPISDRAVVEITNPDTGVNLVFFWSEYGPYVMDGRSAKYIGTAIEEPPVPLDESPYWWLDPTSVVVGHHPETRELVCYYEPITYTPQDVGPDLKRERDSRVEAVVFNYRYNSWYRYKGTLANTTLTFSFTGDSRFSEIKTLAGPPSKLIKTSTRLTLVGGPNGYIYSYNKGITDGVPKGFTLANPYSISAVNGETFTLTGFVADPAQYDFKGCWATVIQDVTGLYYESPIINNTAAGDITLDSQFTHDKPFTPTTNDKVYLCHPVASIEFPWDELDNPFFDKKVNMLITWHLGEMFFRFARNYSETSIDSSWESLTDSESQRKKTTVSYRAEAVKLYMYSIASNSTFDGHVYMASVSRSGNVQQ